MPRTTGGRLAGILLGYAALAVVAGVAVWFAARPLIELQTRRLIEAEERGFRALNAQVDARTFGAIVAQRSAVDGERGVRYSLRAPNGVVVAGELPDRAWDAAEGRGGWRGFRLADPAHGYGGQPRAMLGRTSRLPDGSTLFIAYDVDRRVRASSSMIAAVIASVVFTALLGAVAALAYARQTNARMAGVSVAMNRILAGDLTQRLPVAGGTGVDRMADMFNVALERIERLTTTMRAVADSTAHDLRAPLNRLRAATEVALRREDEPAELRAALGTVLVEVDRVQNTLEALLRIALAESGTAPMETVDLTEVAADVEELYAPLADEKGLGFATRIDPGLALPGNRQLLAQAAANLIDNAIKFTPAGGRVALTATGTPDSIVLEVADTGPGIPPADRERALERSRRLANAAGKPGSGLGLSLVRAVARLHGGRFELDDNRPGLRARLVFAREPAAEAGAPLSRRAS